MTRLRRFLVLLLLGGLAVVIGRSVTRMRCVEDSASADFAPGVTVADYCSDVVRDQLPALVVAVTAVVLVVGVLWTVASRAPARR